MTDHRDERDCWLVLARLLPTTKKPPTPEKVTTSVIRCLAPAVSETAARVRADKAMARCRQQGWISSAPLRLTEPGRKALRQGLGLRALPEVKTWRDVQQRVLLPAALGQQEVGKRALSSDEVAARALAVQAGLPPGASLRAVVDRLAWRALGVETAEAFEVGRVQRHLLRNQVPADVRVSANTWRRMLAMKATGAARTDASAMREAILSGWVSGNAQLPSVSDLRSSHKSANDNVGPSSTQAPFRLDAFAAAVLEAARAPGISKFHNDRAFIASVWEHMRGRPPVGDMTLAQFKEQLVGAHRAGLLQIVRADLVTAMDPKEVQRSQAEYLGATFHFVALKAGGAR